MLFTTMLRPEQVWKLESDQEFVIVSLNGLCFSYLNLREN